MAIATPYRRLTDPVLVAVGSSVGQSTAVPVGWIPANADAFQVVNSNSCYVRLRGFKVGESGEVEEGKGWLLPPGHVGVYATQKPERMSAMAVVRDGFPIPATTVPLEVNYGFGI